MLFVTVIAVVIAAVLGLIVKSIFAAWLSEDSYGNRRGISKAEYVVVALVMGAIFAPLTTVVGRQLSVDNIVTYTQFVNGAETAASDNVTKCYAGHSGSSRSAGLSNCDHTYVAGSYSWQEMHTRQSCDSKGNCTTEIYYTTEYANIYAPYATHEHKYVIESSMGAGGDMKFTFPYAYLDANPVPFSYHGRAEPIPAEILRGAPADWTEADARLKAGDPRAVTKLSDYKNYILASKDELLTTFGPRIEEYKAANLLPDHTWNINSDPITGPSRSQAEKVSFVGMSVADPTSWQQSVMRLNASLGMKLQGDLHVVLVDAAKVPMPDAVPYTQSLKAYWQSDAYGKRAIAKNGIILVLGVNASQGVIDWAEASTGMPFGNELMIQYLRDELPGKVLEPNLIFGEPKIVIKPGILPDKFSSEDYTITLTNPPGIVESILFEKAPFKRARMSCDDGTCVGYKDLLAKIEPTGFQKALIVVVTEVIALALWVLVGFTTFVDNAIATLLGYDTAEQRRWKRRQNNYYNRYTL